MNHLLSGLIILFLVGKIPAQSTIQWQKSFGGSAFEEAYSIQQTSDSGFIMIGVTYSNNGDVSGNHGGVDFWVLKLNDAGVVQWKKAYGGSNNDWPFAIQQTSDGGYIMTGRTNSNNGDVFGNHGDRDFWVVKLNETGVIQWKKTLGGSVPDEAHSIQLTNDGGYIVAGGSASTDGDVSGNHGYFDFWVVKLSGTGAIQWQKSLGGSSTDGARDILQTSDGGFIVVGETMSNDGDVSGSHGDSDFWIVKLDQGGNIEWQKALGGIAIDIAQSICQASDGGYAVAGYAASDVPGYHGNYDYWVVKLNITGEILWQKAYGGSDNDLAFDIQPTSDNGFIVIGDTQSEDGDVLDNDGGADIWVIKLNEAGEIVWQKTLGGTMAESGYTIQQTSDSGYILAGFSWSNNGDVSGNHGESDFWVVKLSPESSPTSTPFALTLEIFPNPASNTISFLSAEVSTEAGDERSMTLSISDLLGREVNRQTISKNSEIDIAALPNGLYLLTATTPSGKMHCGKFIKQK